MRNTIDFMRSITSVVDFKSRTAECFLYQGAEAVAKWTERMSVNGDHRSCVATFITEMFSFYEDIASLTITGIEKSELLEIYDYCKQKRLVIASGYEICLDMRNMEAIIVDRVNETTLTDDREAA